jgi:hypothetical protein
VHGELVVVQLRERLAARVQIASLGERDQLLELGPERLRPWLGRPDALVLDQLLRHRPQHRPAVSRIAAQLAFLALVPHRRRSGREP